MIKELPKQIFRFGLLVIALVCIVLIRTYEDFLFYDPFLDFFKTDYQNQVLPDFNDFRLFLGITFRYGLHMILSLLIVYLLFGDKKIIFFSSLLYLLFFVILIGWFFILLHSEKQPNYLILFYVRRFLIQPLFLVLFVPAFYYQKMIKK